ncbi:MAG: thiolase family protein [Gammaproteobacteria bacterium]|jgi:acetyl-CoA acetyltransferase|nr:thiolase family protein [Gammaproteobacteria bacterium]MBT3867598.1 thiolase family protein [Gammaproteobacteria bacterium]MBT4381270.1 thiolase family protein [Gammaproteobacteria bacterium]MBT4616845.1 thiolase family protein [Gammaproteobacteria bacterium]MBT5196065.1 thiolase family protein [Gammaproteobacteria bacterium]
MDKSLRGKVAIVGAADTEVGVLPGRTPMELGVEAALAAIADAGLEKDDIDGLVTCNAMAQPMMYHAEATAEYLQIFPRYCIAAGAGGGTTFSIIHHAASAIATGMADVVVVAMADSMRSGLTRDQAMLVQASTGHPEFEQPYGPTVPAYYALIAQAHMAEFGTTQEQFAGIAVACRAHAARNPAAQMRDLISVEDVLDSRMIADPLHLLDCSLVSDGGSAIVLTSAERAADMKQAPIYLLGAGEGHSHEHISAARDLTTSAAKEAGERAFEMSGLRPADMDFAQLYDCFTPTVLVELEDLGFCKKGEGGAFVESGALLPDGSLPVNTHGGLLSHSHPGNPGSMFALTESVWQLRGEASGRQVANPKNALVHAQGGIMSSHTALVLGTEAS